MIYPISTNYVYKWTYFEAVRELFQNWLDAGGKTNGSFSFEENSLSLINIGTLQDSDLLLGETTKGSESIGQFGEGFKLAALVLVREGRTLEISSGTKKYVFSLAQLFGKDCLNVDIVDSKDIGDKTIVITTSFTSDEIKRMDILLSPEPLFSLMECEILKDPNLYLSDLYISSLQGFAYGYNLLPKDITVNRDRNFVNLFDVKWETSKLWADLYPSQEERFYDLLSRNAPDISNVKNYLTASSIDRISKHFMNQGVVFVSDCSSSQIAKNLGYSAIINSNLSFLSEKVLEQEKENSLQNFIVKLPPNRKRDINKIKAILKVLSGGHSINVIPVKFDDPAFKGRARKIDNVYEVYLGLDDYNKMLITAIHELVHTDGVEGHGIVFNQLFEIYIEKLVDIFALKYLR